MTRIYQVAIIGAGFAGLGMAITLKRAGAHDFVVLERAGEVGGTWRDNTYPGCRCDVPSMLYSYSFELNPNWSRTYPPQPEIWAYQQRCARSNGINQQVRFNVEVLHAAFDETARLWRLDCSDGSTIRARAIVAAMGTLHRRTTRDIAGVETFGGRSFHSSQWDHDCDLSGKRVAVIGTGASAVQFVPEIAKVAAAVRVFQRSAPWILPKVDRRLTRAERTAYRMLPPLQRLRRTVSYWALESQALGTITNPRFMKVAEFVARRHLRRSISDPDLVRKLTPDYQMGCKRILLSNDYYSTLALPHVGLVADEVTAVRPQGVVTSDGVEHPADVIIFGTGFHTIEAWQGEQIVGRDGVTLQDAWRNGVESYHGGTICGFPNLFWLYGPNAGSSHNSILFMIEAQLNYVARCLKVLRENENALLDVRADVQRNFNDWLQRRSAGTTYTAGCTSYSIDAAGRNRQLWPGYTFDFWRRNRRPRLADYHLMSTRGSALRRR